MSAQSLQSLTPAPASLDLIHLRWLQVRATEQLQELEKENYILRNELALQKVENKAQAEALLAAKAIKQPSLSNDAMKIIMNLQTALKQSQSQLKAIVPQWTADVQSYQLLLSMLQASLLKSGSVYNSQNAQIVSQLAEIEQLKRLRTELSGQLSNSSKFKSDDTAKLKEKIEKLQLSLQQAEASKSEAHEEISNYKQKIEELHSQKTQIEQKYDQSVSDVRGLKSLLGKAENDIIRVLAEAKADEQKLTESYERYIASGEEEKTEMIQTINGLKEQVDKLIGELMGNKSHFAKFVELKSENISLQSKLSTVTKRLNRLPTLEDRNPPIIFTPTHSSQSDSSVRQRVLQRRDGNGPAVKRDLSPIVVPSRSPRSIYEEQQEILSNMSMKPTSTAIKPNRHIPSLPIQNTQFPQPSAADRVVV